MEKIAIIGLSCLFPGAYNPEEFWQNLIQGRNTTSQATAEQTGVDPWVFYDPQGQRVDTSYFMRGGYVQNFRFDPHGYHLPVDFLESLDNAARWSLYVAREALRDGGYLSRDLDRCGVILGNLSLPMRFSHRLLAPVYDAAVGDALRELLGDDQFSLDRDDDSLPSVYNGFTPGYLTAVVAKALGLSGVNFTLDAACASTLYSVALACRYLIAGKADLMLAGAVSGADPLFVNMGFASFEAYPEGGRSQPLDSESGGLVSGEGAGMMLLKRYSDALRDGDKIYALVSGVGLSNDGRGKHILTPNSKGQIIAFQRAYDDADIHPQQVHYVECHASGTPLGDRTELNSMETFFSQYRSTPLIGSVKANLGHLLTAAGFASMLKIILSMNHEVIPPTIGVHQPLVSQGGMFGGQQIVTQPSAWTGAVKYGGVNAFGFGGVSAHMVLQSGAQPGTSTENRKSQMVSMAIVGMDAHFGAADGLDAFELTVYHGEQQFTPLPPQRWKGIEHQSALLTGVGLDDAPHGAYIADFDIDFMRFKLPPNAADQPVPQQLLLLKVADRALRDAGIAEGSNVAVIVAAGSDLSLHQARARLDLSWQIKDALAKAGIALTPQLTEEIERIAKDSLHTPAEVNHYTSHIGNIVSSRVAALWNFSGPAFTIAAEENSVFKALEVAQMMLSREEVDAVVVGAVDLSGGVEHVLVRSAVSQINNGTATMSFDRNANGWLVGEGAGAVVLKRQDKALAGERIYAVIDAVQLVHEPGDTVSAKAVADAAKAALKTAGISADEVGYLEAFASGIPAEDEAEVNGLAVAYPHVGAAVGSVKANIGHTFAASGMASLIKTALALHGRFIPAVPAWTGPKSPEAWQDTAFYVVPKSKTWFLDKGSTRRRAAINSLGGDGAAAHVILSESPEHHAPCHTLLKQTPFTLFLVKGANHAELTSGLKYLEQTIASGDLLGTANRLFAEYQSANAPYVLAIVGRNADEVRREIGLALGGIGGAFEKRDEWFTPLGSYFTANPVGTKGSVAFVYPGAFNSYPKLGQDLFQLFPRIYDQFTELTSDIGGSFADRFISPRSLEKLGPKGWNQARTTFENSPVNMMESGLGFAVLYTKIMQSYFKVQPASAFGYSLGEGSMLWALGVWTHGDAGSMAMHASPLFTRRLFGAKEAVREVWGLSSADDDFWVAYFISAPANEVLERVKQEPRVFLTHINTPNEVMIAGDPAGCKRVVDALGRDQMRAPFSVVIHCEAALPEYNEFFRLHNFPVSNTPRITFYSSADYTPTKLEQSVLAHNMARVSCKRVDFPRLINTAYADGARVFIELGPRSTCARWIDETLGEREHLAVSMNHLGVDDRTAVVRLLGKLASHRVPMDLSALYETAERATNERSLVKTITLGGESIRKVILTEENRRKFAGAAMQAEPVAVVSAPQAASVGGGSHLEFLQSRLAGLQQMGEVMQQQLRAVQQGQVPVFEPPKPVAEPQKPVVEPPKPPKIQKPALFQFDDIEEFALRSISKCFGPDYRVYDNRRAPRIPNGDLMLMSRVLEIKGERRKSAPMSSIVSEYDVPENAWFYRDNVYPTIPYSVYMEIALQPCGFLSAYLGPTLDFPEIDFYFRNLDGQGKLHKNLDLRGKTITNRVNMLTSTTMQGIIIQKFDFEMSSDGEVFYTGDATFGYFTLDSLASQAGLDRGKTVLPWYRRQGLALEAQPVSQQNLVSAKPYLRLPQGQLSFLDRLLVVPDGGEHGKGYVYGGNAVDPSDWFFSCHFHQDPVMPGSLGVETMLQAMQGFAIRQGIGQHFRQPHFTQVPDHNTSWRYRGQVLSSNPRVYVEVNIRDIQQGSQQINIIGDASLWREDGLRIYEVKGVSVGIAEA